MKVLTIYGASDDLVEIEGDAPGCDEYNVSPRGAGGYAGSWQVESPVEERAMHVHLFFDFMGVWSVAPAIVEEDAPLPDWPIRVEFDPEKCRYSTLLVIEAPDDVVVTHLGRQR